MDRLYMPCFSLIVLCVSRHRFQRIPPTEDLLGNLSETDP